MTRSPLHIMLAAGGTGGHMMPADVLACELRQRGHLVSFITDDRGTRLPDMFQGGEKLVLNASPGPGPARKIKFLFALLAEVLRVRRFIRRLAPDLVVGFGGYPSAPAMMGALLTATPTMLHEQNAVVGRTNRFFARRASMLALSWPQTGRVPSGVRTKVTGLPVRTDIRVIPPVQLPVSDEKIHILVIGGSQGAHILSAVVPAALAALDGALRERLLVTHQARPDDTGAVRTFYRQSAIEADVASYYTDLPARLASAHLVIARAGASTVAELTVAGRASILVPLSIATDDHQTFNAAFLVKAGAARSVCEVDFTVPFLAGCLEDILSDTAELVKSGERARSAGLDNAETKLADLVETVVNG